MLRKLWSFIVGEKTHVENYAAAELKAFEFDVDEIAKRTAAYVVAELRKVAAEGKAAIAKVPRVTRSTSRKPTATKKKAGK